jgi:hypothetical protein
VKGFIGLVLAAIAIGSVLVGGAIAFGRASTVTMTVHPVEEFGVTHYTLNPAADRLGIQIELTIAQAEIMTVLLQRSADPDSDDWQDVETFTPGSNHHVNLNTIVYLDEDVKHMVAYSYRVLLSDSGGGSGQYYLDTVTASDPSR